LFTYSGNGSPERWHFLSSSISLSCFMLSLSFLVIIYLFICSLFV
jgi:hypothetical protein